MDEIRTGVPSSGVPVVPVENAVVEALVARAWRVAVAESLTGGALAARLCASPGTGDRVAGGVVAYSTDAKRKTLGVQADSVVSADAAVEMARAVRSLFGTDVGVGVTGVAGPEPQEDQPVGTVFVGWSRADEDGSVRFACAGDPAQIRAAAADQALALLLTVLRPPT